VAHPPHVRASDADRERIAARLRQASMEGRLGPEELEERIHGALSARTYGELEALVCDLPAPPVVRYPPMVVWAGARGVFCTNAIAAITTASSAANPIRLPALSAVENASVVVRW